MSSQRLSSQSVHLERFDVVGQDSDSMRDFVRHVGLSREPKDAVSCDEEVLVGHMGPPFENHGLMRVHSVGNAALTVDQANRIELYLSEVDSEYDAARRRPLPSQQYVVVPHVKPWCAKDGTTLWLRFSCAGLVIESYREAGIDLVDHSENSLPPVTPETLDEAYPDFDPVREMRPDRRESLGLPGDGPWRVVLAGYVLHALNRAIQDIRNEPYRPSCGDATFP